MLLSLGVLIGAARLFGEIAQRFHQPAVLGELLAGVLLGPTVFGSLAPDWQAWLFPLTGNNAIVLDAIGSLAIVLFLLVAGLEVDLSIVWERGRTALKVGVLGTIIPFAIGLVAAWLLPQALGRQANADPWIFSLFLATAMAISSLPVIAKTLMDLNLYRTDLGMIVVSAAIFNDLIGWTIFALILGMINEHGATSGVAATVGLTLLYAALMLTAGRWLVLGSCRTCKRTPTGPPACSGSSSCWGCLARRSLSTSASTRFLGRSLWGSRSENRPTCRNARA